MSKKKILTYIGSPLLLLAILTATALAINSITEGYRIAAGSTGTKVTSASGCQTVSNGGGTDIFVPTNTTNEWNVFLVNKPPYITLGQCIVPPTAPQDLAGSIIGSDHYYKAAKVITLTWRFPYDVGSNSLSYNDTNTGYNVYRSTALNGTYTKLNTNILPACPEKEYYYAVKCLNVFKPSSGNRLVYTYTDTGLSDGTTYYYKISAVNSIGEGPKCSAINVKTMTPIFNSASGKSCTQVCNERSLSCFGISTNATIVNDNLMYNTNYPYSYGVSCVDYHWSSSYKPSACDRVMETNGPYQCSGRLPFWTYCACQ